MMTAEERRTAHIGPGMYPLQDLWKDFAPPAKFVGSRFAKRAHEAATRGEGVLAAPTATRSMGDLLSNVHFVYESDRRAANAVQVGILLFV